MKPFLFLTLSLSLLLAACGAKPAADDFSVLPQENRPNIVFILTDDQDAKLGSMEYMKNLQDLMIARGTSWDDFLVSTPVCCPSRTSIMRGQYVHSHQVVDNTLPDGGFYKAKETHLEDSTIGVWLQAAGYNTMFMGKYLNGYPYPDDRTYFPPGWTEWYSPAKKNAYDGYDYVLNETGTLVEYPPYEVNYFTDVMSRKAVDFINRYAKQDAPFFMYLSSFAPHEPATPAQRHLDLFPDAAVPLTPSFDEEDVSDKPAASMHNPRFSEKDKYYLNKTYRNRILSLQAVDEMLATVIHALEASGEMENTYIIYASDNGFHIGQHRLGAGKTTFYEEDIVVPFIVRGPDIAASAHIRGALGGNIDIAPTLAELAGVQPPSFVEGRSLAPILRGEPIPQDWRTGFLLEIYNGDDPNVDSVMNLPFLFSSSAWIQPLAQKQRTLFGIRAEKYMYAEYSDGFRELYDLSADPYELQNLAAAADPAVLEELSNWLADFKTCGGASCRQIDSKENPFK